MLHLSCGVHGFYRVAGSTVSPSSFINRNCKKSFFFKALSRVIQFKELYPLMSAFHLICGNLEAVEYYIF